MAGHGAADRRGRLNAAEREAAYNASRSAQQLDATWSQLRGEIHALYAQATQHDRVLAILDEQILPKARQVLDLSIEGYRTDRVALVQLIDNYRMLVEYQLDYHRRQSAREQAIAALERKVGCAIATWPVDPLPPRTPSPRTP
jgi:outer membrane protein TolC